MDTLLIYSLLYKNFRRIRNEKTKEIIKKVGLLMMAVVLLASTATTSKVVFATPIETKVGIVVNDEIKEIPKDMCKPFLAEARTFVPLRFDSSLITQKSS